MVAVDTVLFAINDGRLQTYLVELRRGPGRGRWAFPGGLVRVGELLDDAARRELHDSTGLARRLSRAVVHLRRSVARPARARRVGRVHGVDPGGAGGRPPCDKYATGKWYEVTRLPQLAYDHSLMAAYAVKRLKSKLEYTNIAYALLPREFTFAEFEELYSMILGRPLDRRNFRRQHSRDGNPEAAAAYAARTASAGRSIQFRESKPKIHRDAIISGRRERYVQGHQRNRRTRRRSVAGRGDRIRRLYVGRFAVVG